MEVSEQIEKFQEFFDSYKDQLQEIARLDLRSIQIDFSELSKFDLELAENLLSNPEDILKAAEVSLTNFDIPFENIRVRFFNLPNSQKLMIRDIRAAHLGRFISIEGLVRQTSDVRPQVIAAKFECPSCGNAITILQIESKFKEPSRCSCGRQGRFRLISKDLVDAQRIVLEETPEALEGGEQPKRLAIFLKEDLVEPKMERHTTPGNKICVTGIVKEIAIPLRTGGQSTRFDLVMDANIIKPVQEDFIDIKIDKKDEEEIKKLAKDPRIYEKFVATIAPSIYGHEDVKAALVLQLMGGVKKIKSDGTRTRGDMHILLVGDPGSGKSQLLQFISKAAPKARYVSGKGSTSAGLTASVVKDEFLRGWALEAGALVLANFGIVCLDELDKIAPEDLSALHEGLEQQSYHPDFKIMFSDGSVRTISNFVDELIDLNKPKVIKGKNCEILIVNDYEVLTTDFNKIFPTKVSRVSRHKAPDYFIEVEFSNGRKIKVTPEHPFFVYFDNEYKEVGAEHLKKGFFIPAPRTLPLKEKNNILKKIILNSMNKKLDFPTIVDLNFARFLGYLASEGHTYYDQKNHYAEIGISNTDPFIINDVTRLFDVIFKAPINCNTILAESKKKSTKDLKTLRLCSVPLYNYFKENFEGLTHKSLKKCLPNTLRTSSINSKLSFLKSAFRGDGFVDSERFGYTTASYELAKGYSDFLLSTGCWNYIAKENRDGAFYYKVVISGYDSMIKFLQEIVEPNDKRYTKILTFCNRSKNRLNDRDILPLGIVKQTYSLLKDLRMADGYLSNNIKRGQNAHIKKIKYYLDLIENRLNNVSLDASLKDLRKKLNITLKELSSEYGSCKASIYNLEKRNDSKYINVLNTLAKNKLKKCRHILLNLKKLTNSDIRFVTVKSVKKIKDKNVKWAYDVTVEPSHTFLSEGLVLHNTITIAKANIQATLRTETTVLAAANPKFGRFDPYSAIASQIDLQPTLINRFDLIFPIRDIPNLKTDERIAKHVLEIQQKPEELKTEIPLPLFRKYIAYVKQNIFPQLTDAAIDEIKNFYVDLRNRPTVGEETVKPIPISARQLEALVRLSEGSARVRLSQKITKQDAIRAIDILKHCLMQVGFDYETGQIDIDRISTGISTSERKKIISVREIIAELEKKLGGKMIPIEDVVMESKEKGIAEDKVNEAIEKLKRSGDVYEPRHGFIARV